MSSNWCGMSSSSINHGFRKRGEVSVGVISHSRRVRDVLTDDVITHGCRGVPRGVVSHSCTAGGVTSGGVITQSCKVRGELLVVS